MLFYVAVEKRACIWHCIWQRMWSLPRERRQLPVKPLHLHTLLFVVVILILCVCVAGGRRVVFLRACVCVWQGQLVCFTVSPSSFYPTGKDQGLAIIINNRVVLVYTSTDYSTAINILCSVRTRIHYHSSQQLPNSCYPNRLSTLLQIIWTDASNVFLPWRNITSKVGWLL